jgi:arylsulfatase A-like enzyme
LRSVILVFIALFYQFLLVSCETSEQDKESQQPATMAEDLCKDYDAAERLTNTQLIDFSKERSLGFLVSGWSEGGVKPEGIWAVGSNSDIFFVTTNRNKDVRMKFRCIPFLFKDSPRQSITISINGEPSGNKIYLHPKWDEYSIVLPKRLLRIGKNFICFRYGYSEKPSNVFGGNDTRDLSVRFSWIEFESGYRNIRGAIRVQNGFAQTPGSVINTYEYLPDGAIFKFEFNKEELKNIIGVLRVIFDNADDLVFEYSESGVKSVDLQNYANEYACFSFYLKFKDDAQRQIETKDSQKDVAVWKNLKICEKPLGKTASSPPKKSSLGFDTAKKLRKCDVIYIVFDAYAAEHSSSYGYSRKTSPFFDQLASQGVLFNLMFASAPYTLASTSSLFTSSYSQTHNLINPSSSLNPDQPTLAGVLKDHNISTVMITGHGYLVAQKWGLSRGFEEVHFDLKYGNSSQAICNALKDIYSSPGKDLQRKKFIYIHLIPPHQPYLPPARFRIFGDETPGSVKVDEKTLREQVMDNMRLSAGELEYVKALYDANVLFSDHILKDIYSFFEANGILKRAVVIVASDHGEAFNQHGKMGHNSTLYDEMIHVPFLIVLPQEMVDKGRRIEGLASLVDVAPTITDIFGIGDIPSFKGKSLLTRIVNGKGEVRSFAYSEIPPDGQQAIRNLNFKLIKTQNSIELYNIKKDPHEKSSLTTEFPILAGYLLQEMRKIQRGSEKHAAPATNETQKEGLDEEVLRSLKELGYIK